MKRLAVLLRSLNGGTPCKTLGNLRAEGMSPALGLLLLGFPAGIDLRALHSNTSSGCAFKSQIAKKRLSVGLGGSRKQSLANWDRGICNDALTKSASPQLFASLLPIRWLATAVPVIPIRNEPASVERSCTTESNTLSEVQGTWGELLSKEVKWRLRVDEYLSQLSNEQSTAVNLEGKAVRVIAGPGSGKTRVLTARIAKLLAQGVAPQNILVLTFTNKAANEIRNRLIHLLGEDIGASKALWAGTFHSIASRLVRTHICRLHCLQTSDYVICDEEDSMTIVSSILYANSHEPELDSSSEDSLRASKLRKKSFRLKIQEQAKNFTGAISFIKERTPTACTWGMNGRVKELAAERVAKWDQEAFVQVWDDYHKHLKSHNCLDFGDLLGYCNKILSELQSVLRMYQRRFKYILVDEAQDMNVQEYEFLRLLAQDGVQQEKYDGTYVEGWPVVGNSLFLVGDPNQSIYAWRGAMAEHLLYSVKNDFPLHTVFLCENYRSHSGIVEAAEAIVEEHSNPVIFQKLVPLRQPPQHQNGHPLSMFSEPIEIQAFHADKHEAAFIASTVERLKKNIGIDYRDMAVLIRARWQSRLIEQACGTKRIPYHVHFGAAFWTRKEVKDLLCYLRLLVNPSDAMAFQRIINRPARGFGTKTLEKIKEWAEEQEHGYPAALLNDCLGVIVDGPSLKDFLDGKGSCETGVAEALGSQQHLEEIGLAKKPLQCLKDFRKLFVVLRSVAQHFNIRRVVDVVLRDGGYSDYLEKMEGDIAVRKQNIAIIKDAMVEVPQDHFTGLDALKVFVQEAALWSDSDVEDNDSLFITTLHGAKGLEFKVVFFAGCDDKMLPLMAHASGDDEMGRRKEEARLAYVGFTRAKDKLYVTWPRLRRTPWRQADVGPSPFISHLIDKR